MHRRKGHACGVRRSRPDESYGLCSTTMEATVALREPTPPAPKIFLSVFPSSMRAGDGKHVRWTNRLRGAYLGRPLMQDAGVAKRPARAKRGG